MAIEPSDLELWVGNEGITDSGTLRLSLSWEVRHITIGEIVDSSTISASVAKRGDLAKTWDSLVAEAEQALESTRSFNEAVVGDNSLHDIDLILDGWLTDGDGYEHPVCGTLAGPVPVQLRQRLNFILASVAPPPGWFWAESTAPGELRVKCVSVDGADSYNIYNGETLLDNVAASGWQTISVPAGVYSVREAALVGAQVGILSFPVAVTVE